MKSNNLLIRLSSLDNIDLYKEKGINNFLFALKDYSIGYNSFDLDELSKVEGNVYLLINRIFDNNMVEEFKKNISKLSFVKGIFFEDISVYMLLKDSNISLIWNTMHAVISSRSINSWLSRVDSACLSCELTFDEITFILNNTDKPLVLSVFGKNMIMYSRRTLISNYASYSNNNISNNVLLETDNHMPFKAIEDKNGTVFFFDRHYNYINRFKNNSDKILFFLVHEDDVFGKELIDIINGKETSFDNRFLDNETIYKLEAR